MSSECVCHTNKWCFYCEMYVPLERTLADRDAEIQRLQQGYDAIQGYGDKWKAKALEARAERDEVKQETQTLKELISGNKGIEELYTAQQNLFNANFEIKILKNLVKSIDNEKDAEIQRLRSALTKICHYPPAETTANVARYYEEMRAAATAALSHQTEQPTASLQAEYDALHHKHKVVVKLLHAVSDVLIDGNARSAWLMIMDWVRDNAPGQTEHPDTCQLVPAEVQENIAKCRLGNSDRDVIAIAIADDHYPLYRPMQEFASEEFGSFLRFMAETTDEPQPAPKGEDSNADHR